MKKIIASAIICLFGLSINAQHDTLRKESKHALGFGVGFTTGYGLSYRHQGNKFGTQINFAPYTNKEGGTISFGVTFLRKLASYDNVALFLYQGNHIYYTFTEEKTEPGEVYFNTQPKIIPATSKRMINNGLGLDLEVKLNKNAGFHLMAGYAGYDKLNFFRLTGETALFFKF